MFSSKVLRVKRAVPPNFSPCGNAVTDNGLRYRGMLTNFLWSLIDDIGVSQQNVTTCHTITETFNSLQMKFPDRIISRDFKSIVHLDRVI